MRRRWIATTLLAVCCAGPARAEGTSCLVRLRAPDALAGPTRPASGARPSPGAAALAATTELATLLETLPVLPRDVHPLLASRAAPAAARGLSKARDAAALALAASSAPGARPAHALGGWYVLRFASAPERDAALAALQGRAGAILAEPVRDLELCEAASARVPPRRPTGEIPWNVEAVRAPEAMSLVRPDSTLLVAVIDTGVDLTHPDLVRRLWRNDDPPGDANLADDSTDQNGDGIIEQWEKDDDDDNGYVDDEHGYDFTDAPGKDAVGDFLGPDPDPSDEHGHGTHVAGILAADGSLRGVAPFVQLLCVRAAYTTPFGGGILESDDAAAARS